jgi:hypothetical protein
LTHSTAVSGSDFHQLVSQGKFEQVKKELERDSRLITLKDELGRSALMLAVQKGNFALANYLVNQGCKVNGGDNLKNYTALHYAALYNHCRLLKYLLSRRADVSAQDNEGNFPIHIAAANGCSEAVKLLLIHRAEVNSMNHYWQTPLHLAARGTKNKKEFPYALNKSTNYLEVAELLLESGAFSQLKDVNQNMPATILVKHRHDTNFAARFLKLIKKYKD